MTNYLLKNLKLIESYSDEYNLKVHLVQPSIQQSFFYNVIGKGMVAPKPPSPFQWCTERMKILPMDHIVKAILLEQRQLDCDLDTTHDAYMFVGSRLDESTRRAANIKKLSSAEGELFGINPTFKEVKMVYPVKFISTADLWTYLTAKESLPWGLPSQELFDMYSNGEECPIMASDLKATKGCGSTNSRNGCWTCLYAGAKDKMLETLIDSGEQEVRYLSEWKAYLYNLNFDVRYREPFRKKVFKQAESIFDGGWDLFSGDVAMENFFDLFNGDDYAPGGYTFEFRLMLLQKLLYAQKMVGYELIEQAEIDAIVREWQLEGYRVTKDMLVPINHKYDGELILNQRGKVNESKTTVQHPYYFIDLPIRELQSDLVKYIKERQRETWRGYHCLLKGDGGYLPIREDFSIQANIITIVVCEKGVQNEAEAYLRAYQWFYLDTHGAEFAPSSQVKKAANVLLLEALKEGINHKVST